MTPANVAITLWDERENEERVINGDMSYFEYRAMAFDVRQHAGELQMHFRTYSMLVNGQYTEVTIPVNLVKAIVAVKPLQKVETTDE